MRVIVVGAGVIGASTAFHLARSGAEVVLVDQAHTGRATAAGAGIVCPWLSGAADPDWYRIASAGARYLPELVGLLAESGERDLGHRRVGALAVAWDGAELDATEHLARSRGSVSESCNRPPPYQRGAPSVPVWPRRLTAYPVTSPGLIWLNRSRTSTPEARSRAKHSASSADAAAR